MMNKINNVSKSIPSPCKKDCENRCYGCRNECKKYKIYEMLKNHDEKKKTMELNNKFNNIYVSHKDIFAEYALDSRHNRKVMFN